MRGRFARQVGWVALSAALGCGVRDGNHWLGAGTSATAAVVHPGGGLVPPAPLRGDGEDTGGAAIGPRRSIGGFSRGGLWAAWNRLRGDEYALDTVERSLEPGQRIECDARALVNYSGTTVKYRGSLRVNPAFRERLARFEALVQTVAREVYGREPKRITHFGSYSCRPTRNHTRRLSEHALGNALDLTGFDFGPVSKREPLPEGLPEALRRGFHVRVATHWSPSKPNAAAAVHSRFLRELAERSRDRDDLFRVMIGPSRADHADHLHLDMSPWHYVNL